MDACVKLKSWSMGQGTHLGLERETDGRLVVRLYEKREAEHHVVREVFLSGDVAEAVGRALIDYSVQP